jgi:hypothetical protein
MKTVISCGITGYLFIYVCVSFVDWQLDPSKWTDFARFQCVLFGTTVSFILFMAQEVMRKK